MPSIASENGDTAADDDTKTAVDTQTDEIEGEADLQQETESSEESGEDEESEDDEEDDEEPTLKYSRLPIPPELLERDNASTLAVSTRFLVSRARLVLLDLQLRLTYHRLSEHMEAA